MQTHRAARQGSEVIMDLCVIVFLGNPGPEYIETRHNLGWWVADNLTKMARVRFKPGPGHFDWVEGRLGGQKVLLVKPRTFMNASGEAVTQVAHKKPLEPDRLIVVADDYALPLGRIRIRAEGSSGGHKGLASVIDHLGTERFTRVRVGVGPLPDEDEAAEFVLDRFGADEFIVAREMAARAADAVTMILARGVEAAANVFNRKPPAPDEPTKSSGGATGPGESQ